MDFLSPICFPFLRLERKFYPMEHAFHRPEYMFHGLEYITSRGLGIQTVVKLNFEMRVCQ